VYATGFHCADVQLELPYTVSTALSAITNSAFTSGVFGHTVLTSCAALLLKTHGSQPLIDKYYDKMISGEFFGTMALSEPNAGSSLATNVKTTATALPDGTYSIVGDKMWTSAADHDIADHTDYGKNIIHMLLAKTESGVSLFLVPKYVGASEASISHFLALAITYSSFAINYSRLPCSPSSTSSLAHISFTCARLVTTPH